MSRSLKDQIKQTKPFACAEEEVILNLLRTAEQLVQPVREVLREEGLSLSQYNVLRILRGSPDGLSCGEILERMVTRDSDTTRLLDALERRSLVERNRSSQDRRVVVARINAAGLALLERLDEPVRDANRRPLRHLKKADLRHLRALLEAARED